MWAIARAFDMYVMRLIMYAWNRNNFDSCDVPYVVFVFSAPEQADKACCALNRAGYHAFMYADALVKDDDGYKHYEEGDDISVWVTIV